MTAPNRFCTREHDEYLAAVSVHLLREREAKYPPAIEAGRLTAAEAARKLELMRCVVAQWRWIVDRARPLCPAEDDAGRLFGAWNHELAFELDAAAARAAELADRAPDDADAATLAQLVAALAWWQRDRAGRASSSRIVTLVALDRADWHRRHAEPVRQAA